MFIFKWLAQYNKALVPLTMALVYFLNAKYGIQLPINETDATMIWGVITGFLTWAIPNKKLS